MHQSSFDKMTAFRRDYLETRRNEPLVIIDLGSQDINGSYRPLFTLPPWQYLGVDLTSGTNVDVVLADPYDWRELSPESADVIVAGQTFEHTEFFWATMGQIARESVASLSPRADPNIASPLIAGGCIQTACERSRVTRDSK